MENVMDKETQMYVKNFYVIRDAIEGLSHMLFLGLFLIAAAIFFS